MLGRAGEFQRPGHMRAGFQHRQMRGQADQLHRRMGVVGQHRQHEGFDLVRPAAVGMRERMEGKRAAGLCRRAPQQAAARGVALERLRALTEAERAKITLYEGEEWTPRKIMRRMLEYERECLDQIRALLAVQP